MQYIRQLFQTLAPYLYSLRRMIELHPAIFTFSAWSAPHCRRMAALTAIAHASDDRERQTNPR